MILVSFLIFSSSLSGTRSHMSACILPSILNNGKSKIVLFFVRTCSSCMTILNTYSRFVKTPTTIYDGKLTLGIWQDFSWLREEPEGQFIGRFYVDNSLEGRPDLIADRIYSNPLLDWVIIAYNVRISKRLDAQNVLNWPKAGTTIEYPDRTLVIPSILSAGL